MDDSHGPDEGVPALHASCWLIPPPPAHLSATLMTIQSTTATKATRNHFGDQLQEVKWAHNSNVLNPPADRYHSETVRIYHNPGDDDVFTEYDFYVVEENSSYLLILHEVFTDQGYTAPWYHVVGEFSNNIDTLKYIRRYAQWAMQSICNEYGSLAGLPLSSVYDEPCQ